MTEQSGATGSASTDLNDYRVTVRLRGGGTASSAAEHLSAHQVESEVHLRLGGKVVVGLGGEDELFLYTHARDAATTAQQTVGEVLASHGIQAEFTVDRWHPVAEEWENVDLGLPDTPAEVKAERQQLDAEETSESLVGGHALFEVRVQLPNHRDAVGLAERLHGEGYSVVRRWRFLVVGANNADQAGEFADRIRAKAPAGSIVTTEEVGPGRPYTVWELAAGSGL
ncbi:MAG TPA: hypothetical protein VGI58_03150 [Streptosporangiaceae bacterium]